MSNRAPLQESGPRPEDVNDKRRSTGAKRQLNLDEFILDEILGQTSEQMVKNQVGRSGYGHNSILSRASNNCGPTRVAAGASGYLRLSCLESKPTSVPLAPVPVDPGIGSLNQQDNAHFRRLNSNIELLVDALKSGSNQQST
jgi:hypothetical protein